MVIDKLINSIITIHKLLHSEQTETAEDLIRNLTNDAEEFGEYLFEESILPANQSGTSYSEVLNYFIELCSYVENEMSIPSLISDELYDKLVEKLINISDTHVIGSPVSNDNIEDVQHSYPELRGSLSKVHFIYNNEVPKKDTRKSLQWYFESVCNRKDVWEGKNDILHISLDIKFDGVSHVIEVEHGKIVHILTRGDVTNNLGKDLYPLFAAFFPNSNDPSKLDDELFYKAMGLSGIIDCIQGYYKSNILSHDDSKLSMGIKVETYMPNDKFEEYKQRTGEKRCNRRSAVTSICNQIPSSINSEQKKELSKYLQMHCLQVAVILNQGKQLPENMQLIPYTYGPFSGTFTYLYTTENRHQLFYLPMRQYFIKRDSTFIDRILNICKDGIEGIKHEVDLLGIPCDGTVVTLVDMATELGRHDNKNSFQVAFKFPAGEKKTVVEDIEFQVGPIAGRITPVAKLRPIVINGNTISNVTLSNKDKFDRLQLHKNDEVLIRYDIIPTIFKTSDCKTGDGELFEYPQTCPICGAEIINECCSNPDCPAKIVGHIANFIRKTDMKGGIGVETIELLHNRGFLNSIGDLFRLYRHKEELEQLEGLGQLSVQNLLNGISESRKLLPHQILGSIGIPNIGRRIMEKVCRNVNILGNLTNLDELTGIMNSISGIGPKITKMIIEGIKQKREIIEDICANVDIVPYSDETSTSKVKVCFTTIRDHEYEEYLRSIGIEVSDSLTKDINWLIIRDQQSVSSVKINKAQKWGIPIITLSEAKKRDLRII